MKKIKTKIYQYIADRIYEAMEMSIKFDNDKLFDRLLWWGIYLDVHCVYQDIYLD